MKLNNILSKQHAFHYYLRFNSFCRVPLRFRQVSNMSMENFRLNVPPLRENLEYIYIHRKRIVEFLLKNGLIITQYELQKKFLTYL